MERDSERDKQSSIKTTKLKIVIQDLMKFRERELVIHIRFEKVVQFEGNFDDDSLLQSLRKTNFAVWIFDLFILFCEGEGGKDTKKSIDEFPIIQLRNY